jgi:hypothetical protein
LAAIFYVSYRSLIQAAPLFVEVGQYRFPIVIRPRFKDRSWQSHLGFDRGMVTCRGRLGKKVGALTAAHVAAIDGDRNHIHTGDRVACATPQPSPSCEHEVLAADGVMDAALVEDGMAQTKDEVMRAFPYAGYLPLEIASPGGRVPARVVEMAIPQGVVIGTPGEIPRSPALLLSNIPGYPGWSGSMVYQTVYREYYGGNSPPDPYCMFLGDRELHTGQLGRLHMLRQHEIVWGLELLKD